MIPLHLYLLPSLILHFLLPATSAATLPSLDPPPHNLTLPTLPTSPDPICFTPSPLLLPIHPTDASTLLTQLVASFSASPVPWNTPEYTVPQIWTHGTVMLSFSRLTPGSWDVFSELQIAKAMAQVVVGCVTREEGWVGGKMAAGPRGAFMVSVLGRGAVGGQGGDDV